MSESKHTPGPWKARNYKNSDGDVWVDCDSWKNPKTASCRGGTVATAHERGSGQGGVTANAKLIAAAPDLLEAAKTWLQYAEEELSAFDEPCDFQEESDLCPNCRSVGCIWLKIKEARDAITKAEGATQC